MEFNFIITKLLPFDSQGIAIYESNGTRSRQTTPSELNLSQIINSMGELSAIAQGLRQVITNFDKIRGGGQKLFIAAEGRICYGILKIGPKNLFYRDLTGSVKEIKPMCVLDFYVHEKCQRQGYGKILFEKMLQQEQITPEKLAYDRPSPKLIGFLKKHYGLSKFVPQNNNFVVFDQYFRPPIETPSSKAFMNSRASSQALLDNYSLQKSSQQENNSTTNQRNQPQLKNDNSNTESLYPIRNHKEFINVGRAILSQEDPYKAEIKNIQNIENSYANDYKTKLQNSIPQSQLAAQQKIPYNFQDKKLDKIHQKIQQTEMELALVNQQIQRQKNHLSQDPLTTGQKAQNAINNAPSPYANTGVNYYQTSSSNYGNYYTYYRK